MVACLKRTTAEIADGLDARHRKEAQRRVTTIADIARTSSRCISAIRRLDIARCSRRPTQLGNLMVFGVLALVSFACRLRDGPDD
jgi:hypothetical protein